MARCQVRGRSEPSLVSPINVGVEILLVNVIAVRPISPGFSTDCPVAPSRNRDYYDSVLGASNQPSCFFVLSSSRAHLPNFRGLRDMLPFLTIPQPVATHD
jgi:hypothetical protein